MILLAALLVAAALLRLRGCERGIVTACGVTLGLLDMPVLRDRCESSLPWHMVAHIIVMFIVPCFAGWALAKKMQVTVRFPWIPAIVLNVVMVASHLPRVFNFVMSHGWWSAEVMNGTYFAAGLWFFFTVWQPTTPLRWSVLGVIATMAVMLFLAMAMSIFSQSAWYESMASMPGMTMASDFSSQQLAAAILWICGDLWAVPVLVVLLRKLMEREGSLLQALQRYSEPPSRR